MLVSWKETLESLQATVPLPFPVTVSRRKLSNGLQGYCKLLMNGTTKISIVVDKRLSESMQSDVLVHEWAHGLLTPFVYEYTDHGSMWGIMFARCYQAAYE